MQLRLNSKEFAPARGFRRDVTVYSLVCYLNNITGCYLSKNAEPISIFIGRARSHMEDHPAGDDWGIYYKMAADYLSLVESHLQDIWGQSKNS